MSNVQELEMAVSQLSANELMHNQNGLKSLWQISGIKKLRLIFWLVGWMLLASVLMMNF
jgi:hypothetical protein